MTRLSKLLCSISIAAAFLTAADWTKPVEVRHDTTLCLSYQARLQGDILVVRAIIEKPWHTFTMDNKLRADEKLAGKPSLGIDQPTSIAVTGGLALDGPWRQSQPADFSKPDLRWYTWGFEKEALFAAKAKRTGKGPAKIVIRGQACTDSTCKNIDIELALPAAFSTPGKGDIALDSLTEVRTAQTGK
jgi:hypothetical protein